mgnify:FL=1
MAKCDTCACQGICKIEERYLMISKGIDEVFGDSAIQGYFEMPELVCHRYIRQQPISRTNAFAEASNEYLNNYIGEANKNGRVER